MHPNDTTKYLDHMTIINLILQLVAYSSIQVMIKSVRHFIKIMLAIISAKHFGCTYVHEPITNFTPANGGVAGCIMASCVTLIYIYDITSLLMHHSKSQLLCEISMRSVVNQIRNNVVRRCDSHT